MIHSSRWLQKFTSVQWFI